MELNGGVMASVELRSVWIKKGLRFFHFPEGLSLVRAGELFYMIENGEIFEDEQGFRIFLALEDGKPWKNLSDQEVGIIKCEGYAKEFEELMYD